MSASAPQSTERDDGAEGAEVTREGGKMAVAAARGRHRGESSSHHVTSTQKGEKEGRQIKETRDEKGHRALEGRQWSKRCEIEKLGREIMVRQTTGLLWNLVRPCDDRIYVGRKISG